MEGQSTPLETQASQEGRRPATPEPPAPDTADAAAAGRALASTTSLQPVPLDFRASQHRPHQVGHHKAIPHRTPLLLRRPQNPRSVSLRRSPPATHPTRNQDIPCRTGSRNPGATAHHQGPTPAPSGPPGHTHPRGSNPPSNILHRLRRLPQDWRIHMDNG